MDWDTLTVSIIASLCAAVLILLLRRHRIAGGARPQSEARQCPKCSGHLPQHKPNCNYAEHRWD
jgi:hypothetical protein